MIYIITICILTCLLLFYFKIAEKYKIIDKPNERSSHSVVTLRGGGIIFWFAALIYFVLNFKSNYLFFTGITIVSFVSFYDDIKSLPNKLRAFAQFCAISIIFYDLQLFQTQPWWLIIIAYIFSVGIINAYNFMDGINGITGIYSVIVLSSFIAVNKYVISFEDYNLMIFPILASLVFLFFNYRKKAKCFAGDIGSIAMAFWIIYLMSKLMIVTNSVIWILFLAVYGVDSVCTILHRLYLRQNIFKAHRLHFYQILCNEKKIDHRIISLMYGVVQAIVSFMVITLYISNYNHYIIIALAVIPLLLIYSFKFKIYKK